MEIPCLYTVLNTEQLLVVPYFCNGKPILLETGFIRKNTSFL